jgi:hypothetical protein
MFGNNAVFVMNQSYWLSVMGCFVVEKIPFSFSPLEHDATADPENPLVKITIEHAQLNKSVGILNAGVKYTVLSTVTNNEGSFQLMSKIAAQDPEQLEKNLKQIRSAFKSGAKVKIEQIILGHMLTNDKATLSRPEYIFSRTQ